MSGNDHARLDDVAARQSALRLAAVGLSVIAVCYGFARFAYGLFLPAFDEQFNLGSAVAGAIASGSYVAYCVAVAAATVATVLWGARAVAVAAGISAAVGMAMIAAAPNPAVLAVGVVIGGSSTGLASPPLADAVARHVSAERADRVQTAVNAGTGLGVMVSGPVALVAGQHWRVAWCVFALIAVVVTIWTALTIPGQRARGRWTSLLPAQWRPPGAVRLLAAAAVLGAGSAAIWTFGRDLAVTAGGMSPTASTVMWIILGAAGLLGALTGDVVGRVGLARAWSIAMLALAGATTVFALTIGPSIFGAAAVFGALYIVLTGLLLLWGIRIYTDSPAFGVGAPFLLIAAGQALGSPVIGILSEATTPLTAFVAAAAILAIGAAIRPAS
jgi:predicted MFS family arabinose efflux permease